MFCFLKRHHQDGSAQTMFTCCNRYKFKSNIELQYIDTWPNSPSTDPILQDSWYIYEQS